MDKLKMQSMDKVQYNIEKIREMFPNAVTEVKRDEKTELAVDFDVLKQELADTLIDERELRYQFTWPDKQKSILLANTPVAKTLRPDKEKSVDFDNTQNLYIEGDNLDVLKLLRETYLNKIKMIYIDPPYNTGNDFVYEDDFALEGEEYKYGSGQYDEVGNRLFQNTESNGRFHTDWLNMIYPRLKVAKDLLSDDGVIFISIDDNEQANLKKICDEVFGESNFVGCFKWNRVAKAPSLSNSIRIKYEYVFVYNKTDKIKLFGKASYNKQAPLWHLPNKRMLLTFPAKSIRVKQSFSKGYYGGSYQVELMDDLINENNLNRDSVSVYACSAWGQEKISAYVKAGNTFEIKQNPTTFYTDMDNENKFIAPADLISDEECGVKRNTDANEEMKRLGIPFDYSKPVSLIHYLTKMVTMDTKSGIILDFFSGSATTAHAVMQLNAEDGGNRKFIMVQLPEPCDEKSEAYKAGYKTICDIGEERIRRAGKKIKEELGVRGQELGESGQMTLDSLTTNSLTLTPTLDIGFRVLRLDSSNMREVYYHPEQYTQTLLDDLTDNIKEDRTPLDLLFQVMLDLGVKPSAKIEEKEIAGKRVFVVNENELIACFDSEITDEVVKAIAKMQPLYAAFRDSSYASDSVAANFAQIFATYSPNTKKEVL